LKIFERYERPESANRTTIIALSSSSFAISSAAKSAVPDEPPTRMPSSRVRRRAVRNESLSETRIQRSTSAGSNVPG